MKIADRRAVPVAERRPERLSFKDAENSSGQLIALDDAEGIVTAVVSVTGTEDEVGDIIVPGAYRETLIKRNPKVCWAHAWEHPIGKVLYIEEIMPGDDRLPTHTKDGKPWPKEAGALVATMQFNLRTDEGKNAFEAVRFYSETGECEYSIGYQVPAGKSTRDSKGVRHIKALDLYELSVVLFGAHTMTGTLSIKDALGAIARPRRTAAEVLALATKAAPPFAKKPDDAPIHADKEVATTSEEKEEEAKAEDAGDVEDATKDDAAAQPDHSDGIMVALYPDPAAADAIAAAIAGPDPTVEKTELHCTLAYIGKVSDLDVMTSDEMVRRVTEAVQGQNVLTGNVGGLGIFPEGDDGAPTYVPVDVPGLGLLREQIVNALGEDNVRQDHGFTPHITIGYDIGLPDPLPSIPIRFDHVAIVYGTQTRDVPFTTPVTEDGEPWEPPTGDDEVKGMDLYAKADPADKPRIKRWIIRDAIRQGTTSSLPADWDASERKSIILPISEEQANRLELEIAAFEGKAGGADRNRGGAEKLRRYWTTGEGGAKIRWGTPGDFTRCVALLDEHMPGRAEGYCANRHKEMNGVWPGDKANKADAYDPSYDVVQVDTKMATPAAVGKGYPRLGGTVEERQDMLMAAVVEALRGDEVEEGRWEWPGVHIDGTYMPDEESDGLGRVIASRMKYDATDERESYEMTWRLIDGAIELGTPDAVTLSIVADAGGTAAEPSDDIDPSDLLPALAADLDLALAGFKAHTGALEVKAGRVLSGANERAIRESVEGLVDVLRKAGVRIQVADLDDEDDETPDSFKPKPDKRPVVDPAIDTETTSPTASGRKSLDAGEAVVLDLADFRSTLDGLTDGR